MEQNENINEGKSGKKFLNHPSLKRIILMSAGLMATNYIGAQSLDDLTVKFNTNLPKFFEGYTIHNTEVIMNLWTGTIFKATSYQGENNVRLFKLNKSEDPEFFKYLIRVNDGDVISKEGIPFLNGMKTLKQISDNLIQIIKESYGIALKNNALKVRYDTGTLTDEVNNRWVESTVYISWNTGSEIVTLRDYGADKGIDKVIIDTINPVAKSKSYDYGDFYINIPNKPKRPFQKELKKGLKNILDEGITPEIKKVYDHLQEKY